MQLVDIGAKPKTERVAIASGRLAMQHATSEAIRKGRVAKGDVLAAARLAGVMATKKTPDLVPLCHPIALSGVTIDLELQDDAIAILATVKTVDRTGVEMEALTAVCAAALTVYDMCKSMDPSMRIEAVQLESKGGGQSGRWRREQGPVVKKGRRR